MPTSLSRLLKLTSPPVAIAFVDRAPAGVAHVSSIEPAGCGYWRRAAEGNVFYTVADDHKGCPVGAHTHNVPVTPEGKLTFEDGVSEPGKYVEMRAEMDVLAMISNCPQLNNPCNAYNPTPIEVLIWDRQGR